MIWPTTVFVPCSLADSPEPPSAVVFLLYTLCTSAAFVTVSLTTSAQSRSNQCPLAVAVPVVITSVVVVPSRQVQVVRAHSNLQTTCPSGPVVAYWPFT